MSSESLKSEGPYPRIFFILKELKLSDLPFELKLVPRRVSEKVWLELEEIYSEWRRLKTDVEYYKMVKEKVEKRMAKLENKLLRLQKKVLNLIEKRRMIRRIKSKKKSIKLLRSG